MKKRTRNILPAVGLVLLVSVGLISFGGYKIYSVFISSGTTAEAGLREEIRQSQVTKGAVFLD
jgi:peptidoglycan/LPS O-acetylase OafA/YrhL